MNVVWCTNASKPEPPQLLMNEPENIWAAMQWAEASQNRPKWAVSFAGHMKVVCTTLMYYSTMLRIMDTFRVDSGIDIDGRHRYQQKGSYHPSVLSRSLCF